MSWDRYVERDINGHKVKLGLYKALPCSIAVWVDEVRMSNSDFIESTRTESDETGYGCAQREYERIHPRTIREHNLPEELKDKLTSDDIIDIQDFIMEYEPHGFCGWCI